MTATKAAQSCINRWRDLVIEGSVGKQTARTWGNGAFLVLLEMHEFEAADLMHDFVRETSKEILQEITHDRPD